MPYSRTDAFLANRLRWSQPALGSNGTGSGACEPRKPQGPYRSLVLLSLRALRRINAIEFEPNTEESQGFGNLIDPAPPPWGGLNFFDFFERNGLHGRIGRVI
jgi:hypothetical protein